MLILHALECVQVQATHKNIKIQLASVRRKVVSETAIKENARGKKGNDWACVSVCKAKTIPGPIIMDHYEINLSRDVFAKASTVLRINNTINAQRVPLELYNNWVYDTRALTNKAQNLIVVIWHCWHLIVSWANFDKAFCRMQCRWEWNGFMIINYYTYYTLIIWDVVQTSILWTN